MPEKSASETRARADEVASYVASLARELKVMVERHDLAALAYLLELVRLEAEARAEEKPDQFAQVGSRSSNG